MKKLITSADRKMYFILEDVTSRKTPSPNSPEPVKKSIQRLRDFKSGYDENGLEPTLGNSLQQPGMFDQLINLLK